MSLDNSKTQIILLAAGNSTRFSTKDNKLLINFKNKNLIEYNILQLKALNFKKITIVLNKIKLFKSRHLDNIEIIKGGKSRSQSVKNALIKSKYKSNYVIIHDAARPLYSTKLINKINKLIRSNKYDCVVPYSRCSDTILDDNSDIDRSKLRLIKTPQAFKKKKLIKLHMNNKDQNITDDSKLFRQDTKNYNIKYLLDKYLHIKITYKEDIISLNELIGSKQRNGIGYDIHRTKKNDKYSFVNLGGIKVKSNIEVISHSDGDVILHAITDSILGALSFRDIGTYFPNNKINLNRNSKDFLIFAFNKMKAKKYKINNIDLMVVSEEPKINPYYNKMINNLQKLLRLNKDQITIKATTNEKSGLIGKGMFIACWSNISLISY